MPLGDHGVAADAAATEKQPPGVLAGLKRILPGANTAAARAADQTPSRAKVEKYLAEQKRWIQVVAQVCRISLCKGWLDLRTVVVGKGSGGRSTGDSRR